MLADEFLALVPEQPAQRRVHARDTPVIREHHDTAWRVVEREIHQVEIARVSEGEQVARYSLIKRIVSSGWLMCGQCPVASMTQKLLPRRFRCVYSPTAVGAIASSEHCMTSAGTRTLARSSRLSAKKVASAKRREISGSVEQKLASSSCVNSGRSGFFMMIGVRKLAQPR